MAVVAVSLPFGAFAWLERDGRLPSQQNWLSMRLWLACAPIFESPVIPKPSQVSLTATTSNLQPVDPSSP